MTVIGYLHRRKKPFHSQKAYAYAAVAKAEGARLLYFSPGAVDFEQRKVNGYTYQSGQWEQTISDFPHVVCNVAPFFTEEQDKIAERLKQEIPFTSNSIGSKAAVYNNLTKYQEFADYLVPSAQVSSTADFFSLLRKYGGEVVLKPLLGHKGIHVYYIKKERESYQVRSAVERISCDFDEMSSFISDRIGEEDYLIQPYVNCRTKAGRPYDLRLHVQKNAIGQWVLTQIYPRFSADDSIICNISSGGYTMEIVPFLKGEFGGNYYDIQKYMEIFALQLAAHMDRIQKEVYNEELDELGIDIGLDANEKIRVYEINWRPGFPPSMNFALNMVKNAIHYAIFLASR